MEEDYSISCENKERNLHNACTLGTTYYLEPGTDRSGLTPYTPGSEDLPAGIESGHKGVEWGKPT